jgi:hypothetical protein
VIGVSEQAAPGLLRREVLLQEGVALRRRPPLEQKAVLEVLVLDEFDDPVRGRDERRVGREARHGVVDGNVGDCVVEHQTLAQPVGDDAAPHEEEGPHADVAVDDLPLQVVGDV